MKANFVGRVLRARATVFASLAMVLAVVLGTVSVAQAAPGDPFILGAINRAAASISQLVGFPEGPVLRIDNNSTGSAATALDLQVEPGRAPMTVNSTAKVANLNADQLDGKDSTQFATGINGKAFDADKLDGLDQSSFLRSKVYVAGSETTQFGVLLPDGTRRLEAHCKSGDLPLGGGAANIDKGTHVLNSFPELRFTPPGWVVTIQNDGTLDSWSAIVLCADQ